MVMNGLNNISDEMGEFAMLAEQIEKRTKK